MLDYKFLFNYLQLVMKLCHPVHNMLKMSTVSPNACLHFLTVVESEALGWAARWSRRPGGSSSFKKATESMGRERVTNARWEWVPDCGGCNTEGAITSKTKHAIKLTSPTRLAQLLQPSLAFCFSLQPTPTYIGCKLKQNANQGLIRVFIACFILLVIAP